MKLNPLKETGKQFAQAMKSKLGNSKSKTIGALAGTLILTSCNRQPTTGSVLSGAESDYTDGTTEMLIKQKTAERAVQIEAYEKYKQEFLKGQKMLAQHQANGNLSAYAQEYKSVEEYRESMEDTEKNIDELAEELQDLQTYYYRGKTKAAKSQVQKRHETAIPPKREFKK